LEDEIRDSYQLFHLDVPLYLGLNIPIGNLSLFAQAGPYVGYWLTTDDLTKDVLNPFQAGVAFMAGIGIKRFKFELGYKAGLTDLTSSEGGYRDEYTYLVRSSSKLSSVFLGVSYVF